MKIEHRYRFYKRGEKITSHDWSFTIEHNGVLYNGYIEYNVNTIAWSGWKTDGSEGWFMGYLRSSYTERKYKNTYITFGYSNICNNAKYILNAMKEVIEGDFSNIKGVGRYICDVSKLKGNKI
jgi:hypothetical protein